MSSKRDLIPNDKYDYESFIKLLMLTNDFISIQSAQCQTNNSSIGSSYLVFRLSHLLMNCQKPFSHNHHIAFRNFFSFLLLISFSVKVSMFPFIFRSSVKKCKRFQLAFVHSKNQIVPLPLGSVIQSNFPSIFEDFRGTRDGFHSGDFDVHCSDHANTLTIVKLTRGFIS
jgi:hypothetical protein